MYTHFLIGFNEQYGQFAHYGYWTLISDAKQNNKILKVEKLLPKSA